MSKTRVLMVWCVAVSAILIVYRLYNRFSGTPDILPQEDRAGAELPVPEFDPEGAKIGDARVGEVKNSIYKQYDEKTKKLKQVFGFERLLNPKANSKRWPLLKPYMNMYEENFTCEITSDRGIVQVETVNNNPSPTEAELYENVVIKIHSTDPDRPGDSTIYLDELTYNSERSEFSTNGPLRLVSDDVEMEGVGMVLIYNSGLNRIEFMKIFDLDYLRLKNVAAASLSEEKVEGAESVSEKPAKNVEKASVAVVGSTEGAGGKAAPEEAKGGELYQCTLREDVVIRYGDEIIVEGVEDVFITNILMSRGSKKGEQAAAGDEAAVEDGEVDTAEAVVKGDAAATDPVDSSAAVASVEQGGGADVEPAVKDSLEVLVTCKGGIVVKPMTSIYEDMEPGIASSSAAEEARSRGVSGARDLFAAQRPQGMSPNEPIATVANLAGESSAAVEKEDAAAESADSVGASASETGLKPPDRFKARRIEYDMTTGGGIARGPVEVTFYPDPNEMNDPNETVLPMVVTAARDAQFVANDERVIERIVFNRDVVGARKVITPEYVQESSFHGDKMTIDLDASKGGKTGDVRGVSVTGGNVKMESIHTAGETVISHTRLSCKRFDYDGIKKIVYAVGPGNIQLNNENAPEPDGETEGKAGSLSFRRPCFGLVRGFDKLTWFTEAMQINADGKEDSVFMAYWPIVKGERGKIIRGSTTHLQANFRPMPDGSNELATLITAGGIYYEEVGGNIFVGENMLYKADESLLTVTSSEKKACLLNGALVDEIEYEVDTGNVRSELASSPGALTIPAGKE